MKKNLKNLMCISFTTLIFCVMSACFPFKSSINLNDYIVIETEGYNTLGKASVEFDLDKFEADNSKKIKMDSSLTMQQSLYNATQPELLKILYIDYTVSEKNDLSNGDVITVKWKCDDASAKQFFGCNLNYSDIEYTVSGLEEVKTFDPFENITLSYSGIEPNGVLELNVDYDVPEMQFLSFSADKNNNLSEGEEITVSASLIGSVNDFVDKFSCLPSIYEKKYTVSQLSKYINDINEIPSDIIEKMDVQLKDHMTASFAGWENENLESIELIGEYLLAAKPGFEMSENNKLVLAYRVKVNNPEGEVEYIWFGYYNNLVKDVSGSVELDLSQIEYPVENNKTSPYKIKFQDESKYCYYGFMDYDSFYNAIITSNMEKYSFTSKN